MTIYRHFHIGNNKISHVTLAATIVKDVFYYQFSVCSAKDQFQRKIGRNIAEDRLNTNPLKLKRYDILEFVEKCTNPIFKPDPLNTIINSIPINFFNTEALLSAALYKHTKEVTNVSY